MLEDLRAAIGRRAEQPDARAIGIDLRVAGRANGARAIESADTPQRGGVQPASADTGCAPAAVFRAKVPRVLAGRRVVHGVALHEIARDAEPPQRADEVAGG